MEGPAASSSSLLQSLRSRSFAVVALPPSCTASVCALLSEARHFFSDQNAAERAALVEPPFAPDGTPTYRGCSESEARRIVFARLVGSDETCPVAAALPTLRQACLELHVFALGLLRALAAELALDDSALVDLADPPPSSADTHELSSLLSLFRYEPGAATPCGEHVDYTLLTVAPFASAPGLEVLDLAAFEWQCPENASLESVAGPCCATHAVVMAGEALELVSGGAISATTHRVVPRWVEPRASGEPHYRYSCPYLLYARPEARLSRWALEGQPPAASEAPQARDFMRSSQLSKVSAVYSD